MAIVSNLNVAAFPFMYIKDYDSKGVDTYVKSI